MKAFAKRVLPAGLVAWLINFLDKLKIRTEFYKDSRRFSRWSAPTDGGFGPKGSLRHMETQLTKDYHRVEKGLALPAPKRPFGAAVSQRLAAGIEVGDPSNPYVTNATDAVFALDTWNKQGDVLDHIAPRMTELLEPVLVGGQATEQESLILSRRSVRHFDMSRPVAAEIINRATEIAGTTPSVCNRQPWSVTVANEPLSVSKILRLQNGNSGFTDAVPAVGVITVDNRLFAGPGERNQRWVDGGLFAMSFVYALQASGLNSCLLNWSMTNAQSDQMRKLIGLEPYEDIITLVAIGYAADDARVARSPRRGLNELLRIKNV